MKLSQRTTTILIACLIVIFVALAAMFRIVFCYDQIFSEQWVKFTSNDAYLFIRLVDTLVHNFPHLTHFDPYFIFPGGGTVSNVNFFTMLMAAIIWVLGLGHPSPHMADTVAAFIPPIMAALAVIPVFFIGKALFGRWTGIIAASLFAVLPGEFLGRTILGANDMPAPEVLFSTTALAFLIAAVMTAGQRQMTLHHVITFDRKIIIKPLLLSLLGGIFMGMYLITWQGALMFVFIIMLWLLIQFIVNHFRHKPSEHLAITVCLFFLISLLIYLPLQLSIFFTLTLLIAVLAPPVMAFVSWFLSSRSLKNYYYPLALVVVIAVFIAIINAVLPGFLKETAGKFASVFIPGGSTATTTMEMQPFLSPQGAFSTLVAWGNFTTSFFLTKSWAIPGFALISLLILIWQVYKQRSEKENLLLVVVWSVIMLWATLAQRRFAYYFIVNVALLTGYITWQLIQLAGLKKLAEKPEKSAPELKTQMAKARAKKKQPANRYSGLFYAKTILAVFVILFVVFFWNIKGSKAVGSQTPYAPSDGWEQALTWMKDNTPDPLGDPGAYYDLYNDNYQYPASAYGVTAWWDYGYWISRIAHRIPSTNPSQAPGPVTKVANLFLSTNATDADALMAELESKYIIADYELATSKFWAVADWAGYPQTKYFGVYYVSSQGSIRQVQVFTPDYYRTLVVRLYNFDGKAVTGENPYVITYEDRVQNGTPYQLITNAQTYSSYQAAQDFITSQKSGKYAIVGVNPFASPVPLEAVTNFKLVYSSMFSVSFTQSSVMPDVKVFQYTK